MASDYLLRALSQGYDPAARENQLLDLQAKRTAVSQLPEDIDWQREQRRTELEKQQMNREHHDLLQKTQGFKNQAATLDFFEKMGPHLNYDNYAPSRDYLIKAGMPEAWMPSPETFKGPADFDAWKTREGFKVKQAKEKLNYHPTESGELVGLPTEVTPGEPVTPYRTGVQGPTKEKPEKANTVHYETDDAGNTVKIVSDPQGNTVSQTNLGKIGKSKTVTPPGGEEAKISKLNSIRSMLNDEYANLNQVDVAHVDKSMGPEQRAAYGRILQDAERYASTMTPRAALNQALTDWHSRKKPQGAGQVQGGGNGRQAAVDWLRQNAPGYPETDANINAVMQRMGAR